MIGNPNQFTHTPGAGVRTGRALPLIRDPRPSHSEIFSAALKTKARKSLSGAHSWPYLPPSRTKIAVFLFLGLKRGRA